MLCSVMTYSFRRTVARGEMDIFACIRFCQAHGIAYVEPWNRHLAPADDDIAWIDQVRACAEQAGVRIGCVAVDGAHVYADTEAERARNRAYAYHWLDVAARLGAPQVRIDAGGPEDMPEAAFDAIVQGYADLIPRGRARGLEILTENHWGPTQNPDHALKLLDAVPGLGLLFDSYNWQAERREEAWARAAPYARALHIKTFRCDRSADDPAGDLRRCFGYLKAAGYAGVWGIESVPENGDEKAGVLFTRDLIEAEAGPETRV